MASAPVMVWTPPARASELLSSSREPSRPEESRCQRLAPRHANQSIMARSSAPPERPDLRLQPIPFCPAHEMSVLLTREESIYGWFGGEGPNRYSGDAEGPPCGTLYDCDDVPSNRDTT